MLEFNEEGWNKKGFNNKGIHKDTNTRWDPEGYDCYGFKEEINIKDGLFNIQIGGKNKYGFTRYEIYASSICPLLTANPEDDKKFIYQYGKKKKDIKMVNARGFDADGNNVYTGTNYDRRGFLFDGTHKDTRTNYNEYGYDCYGWNERGINERGFNRDGIHEHTGTQYDYDGYDVNFIDSRGFPKYAKKNVRTGTLCDERGFKRNGLYNGKQRFAPDGWDINWWNKEGVNKLTGTKYDLDGYGEDGYNKEEYDREGYDRNNINAEGINRETGEKDERITFAERFIESGQTIKQFAKEFQMKEDEVKRKIEEIRKSPCIRERIDRALGNNANRYVMAQTAKIEEALKTGSVREIEGIQEMLIIADSEQKNALKKMLIKALATENLSILELKRILGIGEINEALPQNIINVLREQLKIFIDIRNDKELQPLRRNVEAKLSDIATYKAPYRPNEGESRGYTDPKTESIINVPITEEHRTIARQYVILTGGFICSKTMEQAFRMIIKGELTQETIERLRKEQKGEGKEIKSRQNKEAELAGLIDKKRGLDDLEQECITVLGEKNAREDSVAETK